MAINDHISNLLARLRNAQLARFDQLEIPATSVLQNIVQILKEEGFIKGYRVVSEQNANRLRIALKASPDAGYAIKGMRRVSRPGRRVYVGKDDIPTVKNGFGVAIVSTSKGVMTGEKAKKLSIGGELLCEVW
ncbi:MAG: 30S ribosomal protein S8 [Deltaproteobacteria bacterium]|nr:MAG: 30S ribosomal protein S8 [Deltaproteobacteria bacterium]